MIATSPHEVIYAIRRGEDIDCPDRIVYEQIRKMLLNWAEFSSEQADWDTFHRVMFQVERLDKVWEPPGGWLSNN